MNFWGWSAAKVGRWNEDIDVNEKYEKEKIFRGMYMDVASNMIDGVKSSHCSVIFEIFICGGNENEKLERKMRIHKRLRYKDKIH